MCTKTDEEILLDAYHKLAEGYLNGNKKKKNVSLKNDQNLTNGILGKVCMKLIYLDEMTTITMAEIQSHLNSSKAMFVQYNQIKARNPAAVSGILENRMEQLVRAMARHEADMLVDLRNQEPGGDRIDIEEVFSEKKYYNRLGSTLARVVVRDAIKDNATSVGNSNATVYITETGKKYHVKDCPYCRRWNLIATTKAMAENQKLTPCKCIAEKKAADEVDHSFVTAFIDESIHPVQWNENGSKGNVGSFSYIICWGHLDSELEISEKNIITKGVDYTAEHKKIERLSEEAIGKVMVKLAYDYDFDGDIHIFTDNMTAMENWSAVKQNSRLAKLFNSVTVSHISREYNKEADKLGRQITLLRMPTVTYNTVVSKCAAYDNLQKQKAEAKLREKNEAEQQARILEEKQQPEEQKKFLEEKAVDKPVEGNLTLARNDNFLKRILVKLKRHAKRLSFYELLGNE